MKEYALTIAKRLPMIASVLVGVLPCFIPIKWFDVPRRLLAGFGVLAYIIGVTAIKMPLYHYIISWSSNLCATAFLILGWPLPRGFSLPWRNWGRR